MTACTSSTRPISGRIASPRSWRRISLPDDPHGRPLVRAVGHCAAGWYAAGANVAPNGDDRPALWFSSDGISFTPVAIKPISPYGPQNILYSVACNNSEVVAVGAAVGGVHGNPRTSTWYGGVGGSVLTEARAAFETYGGPDAVGVGPVAAGPPGFLITGGRVDANKAVGAAVWSSRTGETFTLIDNDPALESGTAGTTELHGGMVGAPGARPWLAVGATTPPGGSGAERDPAVWSSANGISWTMDRLAASSEDDILEQIIQTSDGMMAVGTSGRAFDVWVADASGISWREDQRFGDHGPVTSAPRTVGLAEADSAVYAAIFDGESYHLWRGASNGTQWREAALPPGTTAVTGIAGSSSGVLLSTTSSGGESQLYMTSG
jgi:hypothetical protein